MAVIKTVLIIFFSLCLFVFLVIYLRQVFEKLLDDDK